MFFLVFALVYGALNAYLFYTANAAFPQLTVFWATCFALLYLSVFLAAFLERRSRPKLALPFSWVGFQWLGMVGIAVPLAAVGDLAQLFLPRFSNSAQGLAVAGATLVLTAWAAINAQRVTVKRIQVRSPKLESSGKSFSVVQLSDMHLGGNSSLRRVERIVRRANDCRPDLIVSTGDLFDGYLELMAPFVDRLRELEAPLGKLAICGNHEVYAGLEQALSLTELAGFSVLRNEAAAVDAHLIVAGVDDPAAFEGRNAPALPPVLSELAFSILLKHRPVPEANARYDLQLSGHTHGGQIAPFSLFTKLAYPAKLGLSQPAENRFLYQSRGSGSWGPQLRLFAPTEITLFDISA